MTASNLSSKLMLDINPLINNELSPVTIVYTGRRVLAAGKGASQVQIVFTYSINETYYAQFNQKPYKTPHRVGDQFQVDLDPQGYVNWATLIRVGRVPDREAGVLAVQERVSLANFRKAPSYANANDPLRHDLTRYRELYLSLKTDDARTAMLATIIVAITHP